MSASTPRILLVDDEPAIISNLSPFLERAGFEFDAILKTRAALRDLDQTMNDIQANADAKSRNLEQFAAFSDASAF